MAGDYGVSKDQGERLARIIAAELIQAEGASDALRANRELARAYYFGEQPKGAAEGRSGVISTDVADMTNAVLAMIVPMLSTDAVVEFEPDGEEDEATVTAENAVINRMIIEENAGFVQIQTATKDALLFRNGVMKAWVEERTSREKIPVAGELPEVISILLEPKSGQETRSLSDDGQTVIIDTTVRTFKAGAVPVERMRWQAGFVGSDQERLRFIAELHEYTRSELLEMGCDKAIVAELTASGVAVSDLTGQGPAVMQNGNRQPSSGVDTRDQDMIAVFECYQLADLSGDGVSERYKVLVAGNGEKCLKAEPWGRLPYAIGSVFIAGHTVTGESMFDHLKVTQDTKTALLRQYLDNVQIINNGRYIYDPARATESDILTPKAGGGIRARDPANAVVPLVMPDLTGGILAALNYQDKIRGERGGASLDLLGPQEQLAGQAMDAVDRQLASQEQYVMMMARNLSETMIRQLWSLMHFLVRTQSNMPVAVRQAGAWVQTDPRAWRDRVRLNVKCGLTPGERRKLQGVLAMHQQWQMAMVQGGMGGVLADASTLYRTEIDYLRLGGVANPERLAIDPASEPAKQAGQSNAQAAEQDKQTQLRLAQEKLNIDKAKVFGEQASDQDELQFKYYQANLNAQVAQGELVGQGLIDLERARINEAGKWQGPKENSDGRGSSN